MGIPTMWRNSFFGHCKESELRKMLSAVFLIMYVSTILGNLLIVVTVVTSQSLGPPCIFPYVLLSTDVTYSSVIAPRWLRTLPFWEHCHLPQSLHDPSSSLTTSLVEWASSLLIMMAYGRHVAILSPCTTWPSWGLGCAAYYWGGSWVGALTHATVQLLFMYQIPFCG